MLGPEGWLERTGVSVGGKEESGGVRTWLRRSASMLSASRRNLRTVLDARRAAQRSRQMVRGSVGALMNELVSRIMRDRASSYLFETISRCVEPRDWWLMVSQSRSVDHAHRMIRVQSAI